MIMKNKQKIQLINHLYGSRRCSCIPYTINVQGVDISFIKASCLMAHNNMLL